MKYFSLLLCISTLLSSCFMSDSAEINSMKVEINSLKIRVDSLEHQNKSENLAINKENTWFKPQKIKSVPTHTSAPSLPDASLPIYSAPQRSRYVAQTSAQCQAITKKGTQCKRSARSGGYCWQHGG